MGQVHRSEVKEEEVWDLTPIFETVERWQACLEETKAIVEDRLANFYELDTAEQLFHSLEDFNQLLETLGKVTSYAMYLYSEDGTDEGNQAKMASAQAVSGKFHQLKVGYLQCLAQIPLTTYEQFEKEEQRLAVYAPFLKRIQQMLPHTLSSEMEEALSLLSGTLNAAESVFLSVTSTDLKFRTVKNKEGQDVPISLHRYMTQVETSPDTVLRRNAFESLTEGLKPYQNGLAKTLATEIQKNVAMAKLRGYPSALHMLLQDPTPLNGFFATDGMTPEEFGEVLDTFRLGLSPHMQEYAKLRKQQLGLDTLKFSDVKAPLDPSFDPVVTYEEAGKIIVAAVGVLGEEYQREMQRVFDERWVYRANNVGSRMIPFGGGVHGVHGYSFYPWGGNLFDVLLLGHELGHALHFSLCGNEQKVLNNTQSLMFVEAPSTLTEHLIVNYLKEHQTDLKYQRWLKMYLMMSYHHNCVTHILEAELLRRLYDLAERGKPLTTAVMSATKGEILQEFWGDTVEIDEGAELTWMRQPHYYMGVYPFTYSVGMSAATELSAKIEVEGQAVGEKWTQALKAGGSKNGFELFEMVGLNMRERGILQNTVDYVGEIVKELISDFTIKN